jgi:hypothetical protein
MKVMLTVSYDLDLLLLQPNRKCAITKSAAVSGQLGRPWQLA